jgi:predicted  nucleic acid-binding Zn-ribbon protein
LGGKDRELIDLKQKIKELNESIRAAEDKIRRLIIDLKSGEASIESYQNRNRNLEGELIEAEKMLKMWNSERDRLYEEN